MNNNTDNNLAFWIEWVKLTKDQRLDLFSHINNADILAEIAIDENYDGEGSIGSLAVFKIHDSIGNNEILLHIADKTRNTEILTCIIKCLTLPELRLLFDIPSVLFEIRWKPHELLECAIHRVTALDGGHDELVTYYSIHHDQCIRMGVFNKIVSWLECTYNSRHDGYLETLRGMATIEPSAQLRDYMQQKLDRLTEDNI